MEHDGKCRSTSQNTDLERTTLFASFSLGLFFRQDPCKSYLSSPAASSVTLPLTGRETGDCIQDIVQDGAYL